MADFVPAKTRRIVEFEKYGRLVAGKRIRIMIDENAILDKTVPAGKVLVARLALDGELEDA